MKKPNLKDIVAEIKRIAAPPLPPPPPDGGGGGPNAPAVYNPSGGVPQAPVNSDIKKMQEAMQEFAKVVTSYSAAVTQPGQKTQPINSRKKHFNDFITEQYLANSDIKGEEYTPDEKATSQSSKQPTELIEMNIVVNGLKRIGSPQSELLADNAWDFRTNNALKNVYAFAYGLVNLAKDFGRTNVQSFTETDLNKMKSLIPDDPAEVSLKNKLEMAKVQTMLIKKLTSFYKYYIETIAMHPGFTRYIAGNEPMMTLPKGGLDPTALNKDDQKYLGSMDNLSLGNKMIHNVSYKYPISIPGPGQAIGGVDSVPMAALQNIDHLRAYMASLGYPRNTTSDPKMIKMVLDAIMKHIDGVLSSPQAQIMSAPRADDTVTNKVVV